MDIKQLTDAYDNISESCNCDSMLGELHFQLVGIDESFKLITSGQLVMLELRED